MGWQPGSSRGPGTGPGRDSRLAGFAPGGEWDTCAPSGRLALLADELSGPERRCPDATDGELTGLLRTWAAIESWAAAAKLGIIRELIRREDTPGNGGYHGDLPDEWSQSLRYELAAGLACSTQSAQTTAWLAWEQQARLPGIGALLNDGTLTPAKARAVIETFRYLTDTDAAGAEALIQDLLAGKTYTQVLRLAEQAALTVDPGLAERRREQAQRKDARVAFFREQSGTACLSGRDLPPDEALAAMANVHARAGQYRESGAFGDAPMDVLRAYAYLDLLNDVAAETRIACAQGQDEAAEAAEALAWAQARAARAGSSSAPDAGTPDADRDGRDGRDGRDDDGGDEADGDGGHGPGGPGGPDGPGGPGPRPGVAPSGMARRPRPADLVVPLATLLGLAGRPGEIHGFGLLDPALARELAAAAAVAPRTEVCVTVTSPEGYAIGHGCARQEGESRATREPREPGAPLAALPARLHLTIPAAALPGLTSLTSIASRAGPWAFTPRVGPGAPDGYRSWTLVLPGGRRFTVRLDPVPALDCDHRYETHGYQPSDLLRHLVQIRDGSCTFPSCNRHARESDFEHAVPYHRGGRTCACNAGARSRACHRVKQSPGWNLTQPRPGWHQWSTPSGRVYTQEPKRYPG